MNNNYDPDAQIAKLTFAEVYPHYLNKIEKKGRSKEELLHVITWLTGYDEKKLNSEFASKATFKHFFDNAKLNANAHQITGVICGVRVEEIENPARDWDAAVF